MLHFYATQATYCLLQLACGALLLIWLCTKGLTELLLTSTALAGLLLVLLPHLLHKSGGRIAARGRFLSSLMLTMLFVVCSACVISDAGGSCAANAGFLPACILPPAAALPLPLQASGWSQTSPRASLSWPTPAPAPAS